MIIYKSFFRKRNIKIYIIIYTLLLTLIMLLSLGRKYYIEQNNLTYGNSIIEVKSTQNINKKLKCYSNVKEIREGISLNIDDEEFFFMADKDLKEDEIILAESLNVEKQVKLLINNDIKIFTIKAYHQKRTDEFYISSKTYQDLKNESKSLTYRLNLKNWSNYSKTVDKLLEDNFDVSYQINKTANVDFDNQIRYFSIITIVLIVVLIITLIISIFNLIEDEKKTNILYRYLGYKKSKVKIILVQKLILVFLISILISIILSNLIFILIIGWKKWKKLSN